jgi:DNA-binding GntR family transcriptional regulator
VRDSRSTFAGAPEGASLSERAYLIVRDRILKGDLPLGAALSRRKLAAELGMSMLPVAEALQRLESEGLVESRPRIGTRVCLPTAEDIREHYEVREALETQAARLYSEKASIRERLEIERMAESLDTMFNRVAGGDTDREFMYAVHSFHSQLHMRIAECTGCRKLRQSIEKNHVLIFNWLFDVAAHRPPLPPRHHRTLIEALNQGDPEVADRAMRQHVRYGLEAVVRAIGPALAGGLIAVTPTKDKIRRVKRSTTGSSRS